jgi:hypothetical protein
MTRVWCSAIDGISTCVLSRASRSSLSTVRLRRSRRIRGGTTRCNRGRGRNPPATDSRRSSLKGAGPVNPLARVVGSSSGRRWARSDRRRCPGSARQGRPRSGRRSWTATPPRACWKTGEEGGAAPDRGGGEGRVCAPSRGSRCWTGPVGLSVIPSLPSVLGWFGPVVGSGHPGVPGVAVIPLPSMARGDWPPGTLRRPGCSLRIAN